MKNQLISEITRQMIPYLDNAQMEQLQNVLQHALWNVQITANADCAQQPDKETNSELLDMFLSAKRVEGCSEKTLRYYETSIRRLFAAVDSHVTHMQTDDLRGYLSDYQQQTQCSKGNIDNMKELEAERNELQGTAAKYAEVRMWLDTFIEQTMQSDTLTTVDGTTMKMLVDRIHVRNDGIVVEFKCGVAIEQEYVK